MQLYIHIPFCVRKCLYCDFTSYSQKNELMEPYVQMLLREAALWKKSLQTWMDTVYIGGGTPSVLPPSLLRTLLDGIRQCFPIRPGAEFSIEANPGTLTADWLKTAADAGANRISLGMQACQPEILRILGRIHSYDDVKRSVEISREAGFDNLSLDVMFGIPGQTMSDWQETLEAALRLHPVHLSAYGLIPEPGTPMAQAIDDGTYVLPDPDEEREMYDFAIRRLELAGFRQYEISNFSLPGFECRHNLGYWRQVPYLGLGMSAASMFLEHGPEGIRILRRSNPTGFSDYFSLCRSASQEAADHFRSTETVQGHEACFETMMLGLRTTDGVSDEEFEKLHELTVQACFGEKIKKPVEQGLLLHREGRWRLTRRGMDIQNSVLVDLMD